MATARRGKGVSYIDREMKKIAQVIQGDLAGNIGELSTQQLRLVNGLLGGDTGPQAREKRQMTSNQREKMKISLVPFSTAVPASAVKDAAAHPFRHLAGVTYNTVGVLELCCASSVETIANWETNEENVDLGASGSYWPAQIVGRYAQLEGGKVKTETVTNYYGATREQAITHGCTVPFGAHSNKLERKSYPQVAEEADAVIAALKNAVEGQYKYQGGKLEPEYYHVGGGKRGNAYDKTKGVAPAFT